MGRSGGRIVRRTAAVVLAVVTLASLGCAAPPEGAQDPAGTPSWFAGGTFPIDVSVPPQTASATFPVLWGLATCTSTVTTPSVEIPGATATLAAVELDPFAGTVTIPHASVVLPRSTISAGSLSLSCDGHHIGTVGLAIEFEGSASAGTARLDTVTRTVTVTDPTLSITDGSVTFGGAGSGAAPVPLDPFEVTVPTFRVVV